MNDSSLDPEPPRHELLIDDKGRIWYYDLDVSGWRSPFDQGFVANWRGLKAFSGSLRVLAASETDGVDRELLS